MNTVESLFCGAPRPYTRPSLLPEMPLSHRGYSVLATRFHLSTRLDPDELSGPITTAGSPERVKAAAPDAKALVARQKLIVAAYPDEYVVLLGDVLIAHTKDKEEAFSRFEAAWDESEDLEPIVVPPAAQRDVRGAVLRGRALPTTRGRDGR